MIKQMTSVLGGLGTALVLTAFGVLCSLLLVAIIGITKTWGGGIWFPPIPMWLPPAAVAFSVLVVILIPLLALRKK